MNTFDKMRKVIRIGVASSAIVLTAGAGLTFAGYSGTSLTGFSSDNDTTGPQSLNKNTTEIVDRVKVELVNRDEEDNNLDYLFNTGKNEIENNTSVGNILGGNVIAAFALAGGLGSSALGTNLFTNFTSFQNYSNLSADPELVNDTTGPCSENINEVKIETKRELHVTNDTDIDNDVYLGVNTGKNEVEKNTVVGNVSTGNVSIQGTINNGNGGQCVTCADALAIFSGAVNQTIPDISAANSITGPNSSNKNEFEAKNEIDVDIQNHSDIDNDIDVEANTGENKIECNTVVGNVTTGNVSVVLNANNNVTP